MGTRIRTLSRSIDRVAGSRMLATSLLTLAVVLLASTPAPSKQDKSSSQVFDCKALLADQPNFKAKLTLEAADGRVITGFIAKRDGHFRIELPKGVWITGPKDLVYDLFPEQKKVSRGTGHGLLGLLAPWLLFSDILENPDLRLDVTYDGTTNLSGSPCHKCRLSTPDTADDPMIVYASEHEANLIVRIEVPNLGPTAIGYRTYSLSDVDRKHIPATLFEVPSDFTSFD